MAKKKTKSKKSGETIMERFGRYLILDHLVDGGMAKICRARYLGEQADKIVAIKMIQAQYSDDEAFVKMFEDEIKVTFGLIHPNIAQIYTTGKTEGQLYVAMEYVDGKNLKQFFDRLKEMSKSFPVEIAVYIISQVCQALTYAHNFTDKLTGKKLNLIHRDISPHNIMITYDGAVKVIDFGIAKADTNSDKTQVGTIKGKLSYLAPEYLDGQELDHRYDQFAVGITLWELLCTRKLFKANNDLAVLKLIQACKIPPPSSINPNVPKELDDIVMKALSKDRNLRYKNMDDFVRSLTKFLYSHYPDFYSTNLSLFAKQLFAEQIETDKETLKEFGRLDIRPFLEDMERTQDSSYGGRKSKKVVVKSNKKKQEKHKVLDFGFEGSEEEEESEERGFPDLGDVDKIIEKGNSPMELESTRINKTTNRKRTGLHNVENINSTRTRTSRDIDKKDSPRLKAIPMVLLFALLGGGGYYYMNKEALDLGRNPTGSVDKIETSKVSEKKISGSIIFTGLNVYQRIFVNGVEKSDVNSSDGLTVPVGKDLLIQVEQPNKKTYNKMVKLDVEGESEIIEVPDQPDAVMGEVYSGTDYPDGIKLKISFGQRSEEYDLPLKKPIRLEVGRYPASVINELYDTEKQIEIVVEPDKRVKIPY